MVGEAQTVGDDEDLFGFGEEKGSVGEAEEVDSSPIGGIYRVWGCDRVSVTWVCEIYKRLNLFSFVV